MEGIKDKDTAAIDIIFGEMIFFGEGGNDFFTITDGLISFVVGFNLSSFLETIDAIKDLRIFNIWINVFCVVLAKFETLFEGII